MLFSSLGLVFIIPRFFFFLPSLRYNEEEELQKALEISVVISEDDEKEKEELKKAEIESERLFNQVKISSELISNWRKSAGNIAKDHEFIVCPNNASGIIVGKGFRHVNVIRNKVGNNCSIRFIGDKNNSVPACFLIEADNESAVKAASDALNDRIAFVLNWDSLNDETNNNVSTTIF